MEDIKKPLDDDITLPDDTDIDEEEVVELEPMHPEKKMAYDTIARFIKGGHTDITDEELYNIMYSDYLSDAERYYMVPMALYITSLEMKKLSSNTG